MLMNLVAIPEIPKSYDATDALAVAICHHFSERFPVEKKAKTKKSTSAWSSFILRNPDRVS
ncbi:MAG TPA: crossover junction endodeoxyribonuclease RuvC, partial [Pedobacter sp.]